MIRTWILFAALGGLWLPGASMAAVFERDWKVPGDGLLTYDDVNRREWLDIPESLLSQFDGTLTERIDLAIGELVPGGLFTGFTLAKSPDVIALAQSAGIDTGTFHYATNQAASALLIDLLGATNNDDVNGNSSSTGFLDDFQPAPPSSCPCRLLATIGDSAQVQMAGMNVLTINEFGLDIDGIILTTGLMVYRQVPEPSTIGLALSILIPWSGRRR